MKVLVNFFLNKIRYSLFLIFYIVRSANSYIVAHYHANN